MAIAALVVWLCTAAVGTYLLASATRFGTIEPAPPEAAATAEREPEPEPATVPAPASPTARPAKPDRDPFAPPSLQRERAESLPLLRSLVEFTHPALAMIGLGFWFGYVVSRDRLFLAIGLGILLGAIAAGLTWFTANTRAARRAAAAKAAGQPSLEDPRFAPPSFAPRVLILHGVGAAVTLLIAALITARA